MYVLNRYAPKGMLARTGRYLKMGSSDNETYFRIKPPCPAKGVAPRILKMGSLDGVPRFRIKSEPGYSLVEIIMALAILSLVLAMGCYAFNRVLPRYRLEGAVNSLVSDFYLARMRAIGQNCTYRIQVDCGRKQYLLERESLTGPARWPGIPDGISRKFNDPGNPFYYPGVEIESSNDPVFLPRGNVVGTTIILKNSSGQKKITLSSQGRVKVQEG